MKVAIDIDFTLTAMPDFFRVFIEAIRASMEVIVLTSMVPEIGDKKENFKYRMNQLSKIGMEDVFDTMLIADGNTIEELATSKREICSSFEIDVLIDDEERFAMECSEVTDVFHLMRKGAKDAYYQEG